jgi:hypothetical protein
LGDQFAYPLPCVWSEEDDQVDFVADVHWFGGERGDEVGDFVEENAPERRDKHGLLAAANEDDGCVAV